MPERRAQTIEELQQMLPSAPEESQNWELEDKEAADREHAVFSRKINDAIHVAAENLTKIVNEVIERIEERRRMGGFYGNSIPQLIKDYENNWKKVFDLLAAKILFKLKLRHTGIYAHSTGRDENAVIFEPPDPYFLDLMYRHGERCGKFNYELSVIQLIRISTSGRLI